MLVDASAMVMPTSVFDRLALEYSSWCAIACITLLEVTVIAATPSIKTGHGERRLLMRPMSA